MENWLRNPSNYIQQAVLEGQSRFVWMRGTLKKLGIEPAAHLRNFGGPSEFRILLVGDQGTAELDQDHRTEGRAKALYATWEYGLNPIELLEDWVAVNPEPGQEHRVVVTMLPPLNGMAGRRFAGYLSELQQNNPWCIIHVHGLTTFNPLLTHGFRSGDWEPFSIARGGGVVLPSGKKLNRFEDATGYSPWLKLNGFKYNDLSDPKNRCRFNIRSFQWASRNWEHGMTKLSSPPQVGHEDVIDAVEFTPEDFKKLRGAPGDKIVCNHCTLARRCPFFRESQVCTVPDSDGEKWSKHYKSKDPETIIDGILHVVTIQKARLDQGLEAEKQAGELDPEVTKLANGLIKTGFDVAKLRQPKGALVNVQVGAANATATQVTGGDQHQVTARLVAQLEDAGFAREDIREHHLEYLHRTGTIPPRELEAPLTEPTDAEVVEDADE